MSGHLTAGRQDGATAFSRCACAQTNAASTRATRAEEHGSSIIFQVFRLNLQASSLEEFQSEQLAEIKVDGEFVAGSDTVAAVKGKLRPILEEKARAWQAQGEQPDLQIEQEDHITLFFNGHPMQDDRLFYADHFMLLPAWVQVHLHSCEFEQVAKRAAELRNVARR